MGAMSVSLPLGLARPGGGKLKVLTEGAQGHMGTETLRHGRGGRLLPRWAGAAGGGHEGAVGNLELQWPSCDLVKTILSSWPGPWGTGGARGAVQAWAGARRGRLPAGGRPPLCPWGAAAGPVALGGRWRHWEAPSSGAPGLHGLLCKGQSLGLLWGPWPGPSGNWAHLLPDASARRLKSMAKVSGAGCGSGWEFPDRELVCAWRLRTCPRPPTPGCRMQVLFGV